ncbi:hypothetical protein I3843_14G125000, partial [Carya illinoinensis]
STLTVTGTFLNHSGATYPLVPLIPVVVRVWSVFKSLANPKSEIIGVKESSKSMFCGLILQCMIWLLHSSCKYKSPLAVPNAICILWYQLGRDPPKRKFAKEPRLMNS